MLSLYSFDNIEYIFQVDNAIFLLKTFVFSILLDNILGQYRKFEILWIVAHKEIKKMYKSRWVHETTSCNCMYLICINRFMFLRPIEKYKNISSAILKLLAVEIEASDMTICSSLWILPSEVEKYLKCIYRWAKPQINFTQSNSFAHYCTADSKT